MSALRSEAGSKRVQRRSKLGQQRLRAGGGVLQARRGVRAGGAIGEHEAPTRAHHREVALQQAHEALVLAPGVAETEPESSSEPESEDDEDDEPSSQVPESSLDEDES